MTKTDHMYLFYTDNAKNTTLDIFHNHGNAELIIEKVPTGNQSLDKHLIAYLGYLIGKNAGKQAEYVVVSGDAGNDKVLSFLQNAEKKITILRREKIAKPTTKAEPAKQEAKAKQPTKAEPAKQEVKTKQPAKAEPAKQEVKTKQSAKAEPAKQEVKTKQPAKAEPDKKTKLNQEIQQALSRSAVNYKCGKINQIAKIVSSHYGEERFMNQVHNELRKIYNDYIDIYTDIKPVLNRYVPKQEEKAEKEDEDCKTRINNEIQQVLSKANAGKDVLAYVPSLVVKNAENTNRKQLIYRGIIQKFGQEKGRYIYNRIRKYI